MADSRKPEARNAWSGVIAALATAINAEGDAMEDIARLSMTREQADMLFPLLTMLTMVVGDVRVIREQQSSKSQLNKAAKLRVAE